jgi:heat shock transcription factor
LFADLLSSFLDESKNTDLIRWSDRGDSFVVLDEDEFAKTLIPELFKHNNYASFVRQLNMYGFHKRVGLSDNSMKASERKNKSPSEYYNPYFKRNHPNLLWLINKPKGGTSKAKNKRGKNEEGQENDSDEDARDGVEEVYSAGSYGNNMQGSSRAISAAPESGPLQRREMAVVQSQLADIQKQQGAISNAIARLRKDHNQLYQQAVAFQTLHDRHESSINAILTFLATVYNRSLDGQGLGPQNIAQMFANGIPQDQQQQGNVVDIGDLSNQQQPHPGSLSPRRRQQRLLMAPPTSGGGRTNTVSPSATPQAQYSQGNTPRPGAIEELFESPSDTTHMKMEPDQALPQQGIMNIINNTNARATPNDGKDMEFPEVLSHYQNANGNSPLTNEQRSNMLNLIANSSSAPGSNNALVSPVPPQPPSLEDLGYTQAEIDELVRMQASQDARIHDLRASIEPLSPSGSIPGLHTDGSYFNGTDASDPANSNLDLDQFLDTGAFYNGSSPLGGGGNNFDYGNFGDQSMGGNQESHFDLGMDGAGDGGRIVETAGSSEVGTPRPGEEGTEEVQGNGGLGSPIKRRRKH